VDIAASDKNCMKISTKMAAKKHGAARPEQEPFLRFCLLALLFLFFGPSVFAMTELRLKNGALIKGDVLSEKADRLIVDLGFTVVTVPRDEIDHIVDEKSPAASAAETELSDLYVVNPGQASLTVKENVDRCGDAVVEVRTPIGLGSGFIINSAGYVMTNEHVISGEYDISITQFRRGKAELERVQFNNVRIVAFDSRLDLALLKIEDAGNTVFPVVPLGDSNALTEGQTVFAIGSPLGLDRSVSQGIIAQKNRPLDGQLYIQTTTQVNPGNSGGPLFNLRGEVVGINDMKAMMIGIEGLNFAVPSSVMKIFLQNRDAFAFDPRNPNAGYRYLEPPQPVKSSPANTKLP
jgi:serine protease Do